MPLWTYKLLLFANLAGMAYSACLFFLKRGAVHPLFEKDREIRMSVNRRLGRFSLFFFACFTAITMGVFSMEWSEANVRALLLFEIAGLWLIERYYSRVIRRLWEKRKGFYHGRGERRCRWCHVVLAGLLFVIAALFHLLAGHPVSAGITAGGALFVVVIGRQLPAYFSSLFQKTALLTFVFLLLSVAVQTGSVFLPLPLMLLLFLF